LKEIRKKFKKLNTNYNSMKDEWESSDDDEDDAEDDDLDDDEEGFD